jgi:hypothetical protein
VCGLMAGSRVRYEGDAWQELQALGKRAGLSEHGRYFLKQLLSAGPGYGRRSEYVAVA